MELSGKNGTQTPRGHEKDRLYLSLKGGEQTIRTFLKGRKCKSPKKNLSEGGKLIHNETANKKG